ncbi:MULTISPECIES: hypothetical protein [unclassified Streptomyces]|uniref:hypothetical protein n=1 Tax=unclassified Streptomyces TaxID=2593676 RepID=UPI002DDC15A8|nr:MULTISPECIES: hypothetical protein [unclassified Streptomyces]WSC35244.1 hypothetical protein OHA08_06770 [Streptomyces sp. NBC_01763]
MGAFVAEWGSFVDETPSSGGHPPSSSPPSRSDADDGWGIFEPEPGTGPSPSPSSPPGPAPAADADANWGVFAPAPDEGIPSLPPPSPPAGVPTPSPEVVASLLTAGETLWAHVDGPVAVLGSGCGVTAVYDGEPDGFSGWRPVTVVDPARLTVHPVPLSLAEPPVGATTSVAELYSDTEPQSAAEPRRAAPFPVGQGPDLDAVLNRAVAEERERVRAEAAAAAHRAEVQLNVAKRELAERTELAERHARMREEQAKNEERRAQQEAAQHVAAAQAEAQRQIAAARDQAAQAVQHWQFRAQQAEGDRTRLAGELNRANRTGVQRLVLVGVLAVIAVVLTFVFKGA